jgi:hypothetical protein
LLLDKHCCLVVAFVGRDCVSIRALHVTTAVQRARSASMTATRPCQFSAALSNGRRHWKDPRGSITHSAPRSRPGASSAAANAFLYLRLPCASSASRKRTPSTGS